MPSPNSLLTALTSLLMVLAIGPVLQIALPPGVVWLGFLSLCLIFLGLQYLASGAGNTHPYLSRAQQLGLAAVVVGILGSRWQGWPFGLAASLALGQNALLFTHRFEQRFYRQLAASAMILLLALASSVSTSSTLFFAAYACLLTLLIYARQQQKAPPNWQQWSGCLLSLIALSLLTAIIYVLLPHWATNPAPYTHTSPTPFYQDATWDAKAQALRDGRLPVEILPQLQQQFLLDTQSRIGHSLADYSYEAASPSNTFSYAPFNNSFEINNIASRLAGLRQLIARVQAPAPMNLRAKVFDEFDGIRWHNNSAATYKTLLPQQLLIWRQNAPQQHQPVRYRVQLLATIGSSIPMAGELQSLHFPASSLGFDSYALLQSPAPLKAGTRYSAQVQRLGLGLRSIGDPRHLQHLNFRQLPANLDPRIKPLAQTLTQTAQNEAQKAEQLEAWLRRDFHYHFDRVSASYGVIPVSEFLFDTQRGSSEYFATSLALMLRTLDIPARLVSGFAVQHRNPFTGGFEIYAADAHTWVEAYVDNKGWIELEPMAFYRLPLQTQPSLFGLTQLQTWQQQQRQLDNLQTNTPLRADQPSLLVWLGWVLLAIAPLRLFVSAAARLKQRLKQHPKWLTWQKNRWLRQHHGQDPQHAIVCLSKILQRSGINTPAGSLMESWAQHWQKLSPSFSAAAFTQAYNHYYFGLNSQGDLIGQCQHLLAELKPMTWDEIQTALHRCESPQ